MALSRAIGDFQYKDMAQLAAKDQAVTATPDLRVIPRTPDDEFIVNACDGIWDCLSNQECGDLLTDKIKQKKDKKPSAIVGEMLH